MFDIRSWNCYQTCTFISTEKHELSSMIEYPREQSASLFPTVIAAMHGLDSPPFRLYDSIAFDWLHVFDLGLLLIIVDWLHNYLSITTSILSPTATISVANERLVDLPRSAVLPKLSLFPVGSSLKMSGMTAPVRILYAPYLWVADRGDGSVICHSRYGSCRTAVLTGRSNQHRDFQCFHIAETKRLFHGRYIKASVTLLYVDQTKC